MKSMLQFIAAAVCAAALAACGGGPKDTTVVIPPQPDYKLTETVVGPGSLVAEAGDTVVIKYNGFLYDATKAAAGGRGDKVMSSTDAGGTLTFTLGVGSRAGGVVTPGWDQALLGMRAGGTRTAILPTSLAFNNSAVIAAQTINGVAYPAIPAYAAFVFDFEMVSVTKAVIIPNVPPTGNLEIVDTLIGTGDAAATGKTLTMNYQLYLYDGTRPNRRGALVQSVTDGSFSFVMGSTGIIAGWNQGVVGMKSGGLRTIQVPPGLGYGATATASIPANSTLIFDLHLVSSK
jgi:peptidylprolyl isomerase